MIACVRALIMFPKCDILGLLRKSLPFWMEYLKLTKFYFQRGMLKFYPPPHKLLVVEYLN